MPVRVKQRPVDDAAFKARERVWTIVCRLVTGMVLASGRPLFLAMRASDKEHIYRLRTLPHISNNTSKTFGLTDGPSSFDTSLIRSSLVQGMGLDPASWSSWVKTSARTSTLTVRALISLEPAPSRQLQFLSVGDRFISPIHGHNVLYESINQQFTNSSFAVREEEQGKRSKDIWLTNKQVKSASRVVDRWPMFFIRIDCNSQHDPDPVRSSSRFKSNDRVRVATEVLNTMITSFLKAHHFKPHKQRTTRSEKPPTSGITNPRSLSPIKTRQEEHKQKAGKRDYISRLLNPDGFETKSNFFGDLGMEVRFPMNDKSKDLFKFLDTTPRSRVKADSKCDLENLFHLRVLANNVDSTFAASFPVTPRKAHDTFEDSSCSVDLIDETSAEQGSVQNGSGNGDNVIRWIHPATKELLILNGRTGCVIDATPSSPPASVDDRAMQSAVSRNQLCLSKRLNRTSIGYVQPEDGSWVCKFFDNWENPVFEKTEEAIPQILSEALESDFHNLGSCGTTTYGKSNQDSTTLSLQSRLSKRNIRNAVVISQVDSKFILVKSKATVARGALERQGQSLLVLVDQHAADERIKVEQLLSQLCMNASDITRSVISPLGYKSKIETTSLQRPIFFELHNRENAIFKRHAPYFARWGILYDLLSTHTGPSTVESRNICRLVVLTLPPGIAERCRIEPKVLIEMLRNEAWKREESTIHNPNAEHEIQLSSQQEPQRQPSWLRHIGDCPQGILEMLNSRSCRSAIMFNDELSQQQCEDLIKNLADCQLPFQCAHGRPTMVPLIDFGTLHSLGNRDESLGQRMGKEVNFQTAWKQWTQENLPSPDP
ncbi:MAG: hypothetical protein LQ340_004164 [Diploschistes diacapsis]|nr:MAG: hypothetical protein LQ340_004164 [Diploschistes diacapsis]